MVQADQQNHLKKHTYKWCGSGKSLRKSSNMSLMYCRMTKWSFKRIQLLICWSPNKKITHHSHFTPFVSFFWPRSWPSSFRSLLHHWHLLFSQQQIHDFKRGFPASSGGGVKIFRSLSLPGNPWKELLEWLPCPDYLAVVGCIVTCKAAVIFHTSMSRDDTPFTITLNVYVRLFERLSVWSPQGYSRAAWLPCQRLNRKGQSLGNKYIPELQQDGKHPFPATLSFPAESFFFLGGGVP